MPLTPAIFLEITTLITKEDKVVETHPTTLETLNNLIAENNHNPPNNNDLILIVVHHRLRINNLNTETLTKAKEEEIRIKEDKEEMEEVGNLDEQA